MVKANKPIGCTYPECGKCKLPDCEWDGYELDDLSKIEGELKDRSLELKRARARRYYESHKEKVKAYNREYRNKNKEKCNELVNRWRNENREYLNAQARDYRKRKKEEVIMNGKDKNYQYGK